MSDTSAASTKIRYEHVPTYKAVLHLLDHLRESSKVTGYKPPAEPKIEELLDKIGVFGHNVHLPAPQQGFNTLQRAKVQAFAQALTYWGGFLVSLDDTGRSLVVTFSNPRDAGDDEIKPADEQEERQDVKDRLKPKGYRAAKAAGQMLVEQGFKVREPVPASLLTLTQRFNGFGMTVRYPIDESQDQLGIIEIYDRVVPMLADLVARGMGLKSDSVKDGEFNVLFFTPDHKYVSSLYDAAATFRMIVPRPPRVAGLDFAFLTSGSYRACRSLMNQYRKDFQVLKRPQLAMNGSGYTAVFHYRRGAGGRTVDEAYMQALGKMAKKLMKKYNVRASISHQAETRCIIVTFYKEMEGWGESS